MAKAPIDIRSLARAHTERALQTLAGIMDQPKAPYAARVAASEALLNRGWGKPAQAQAGPDGEGPIEHVISWKTISKSTTPPDSNSSPSTTEPKDSPASSATAEPEKR